MNIIVLASWIIVGLTILALLAMVVSAIVSIVDRINRNYQLKKINERVDRSFEEFMQELKNAKQDGVVAVPPGVDLAKKIIKKPTKKATKKAKK